MESEPIAECEPPCPDPRGLTSKVYVVGVETVVFVAVKNFFVPTGQKNVFLLALCYGS